MYLLRKIGVFLENSFFKILNEDSIIVIIQIYCMNIDKYHPEKTIIFYKVASANDVRRGTILINIRVITLYCKAFAIKLQNEAF